MGKVNLVRSGLCCEAREANRCSQVPLEDLPQTLHHVRGSKQSWFLFYLLGLLNFGDRSCAFFHHNWLW